MGKIDFAKIEAIRPTFFFKSSSRGITQIAEIAILNPREEANASVLIKFDGQKTQRMIFGVKNGSGVYPLEMPEVADNTEITFDLSLEGKLQDALTLKWPSVRRWEIHLVQHTPHHLNFTNLPEDTLRDYHKFYNRLIDYCEETRTGSPAAQFHYTIETAWPLIHFIRNNSRSRVDKLLNLIREGRIEVSALFGNQITEISGSEELVRLLYPVFRLKRVYDIPVHTAMLTQVSGFSWGLASVLAGAGIEFFAPSLPGFHLPISTPGAFYWEAISGQKVLCWLDDAKPILAPNLSNIEAYLKHLESNNYPYSAVRHLVTSAPRPNAPPTRDLCQAVETWNKEWASPRLVVSTNKKFYQKIKAELKPEIPTFRGDWPGAEHLAGVTSSARELAIARQTQAELISAEKFAAILSATTSVPFPATELTNAYEKLLQFNEQSWGNFHPFGAAHLAALAEKNQQVNYAASHAKSILIRSANKLADQIDLPEDSFYLVVFNPGDKSRSDVVSSDLMPVPPTGMLLSAAKTGDGVLPAHLKCTTIYDRDLVSLPEELVTQGFEILDLTSGAAVPHQIDEIKDPGETVPDAADRFALGQANPLYLKRIIFYAENVPALGYKVYQIQPGAKTESIPKRADVSVKTLENRFYRLNVATNTGGIFSIYDKELEQELVDGFAQYRLNQLFVKSVGRDTVHKLENVNIRREQRGSISMSLIISGATQGCPQCIQEITIYNDVKRIDFTNRILKDATPLQEVYLAFPFLVKNPRVAFEGGLTVQSPAKDQMPGSRTDLHAVQDWVSFSDGEIGIAWTSQDAPVVRFGGAWATNLSAELQLVNSKKTDAPNLTNAHLYSLLMTGNYKTGFSNVQVTDMLFRYSVTSFKAAPHDGHAQELGQARQQPLYPVFLKGPQTGALKPAASFVQVSAENVIVQTVKKSEIDNRLVIRLRETRGQATECALTLNFKEIQSASLANLIEQDQSPLEKTDAHTLNLKLNAWEIVTVQIKLQE
jgi:hypothetical protein